ncbi:MAG: hypothetical protein H6733_15495 [Alphaproteobacteria bacterium]|nr:hypothetical protein [Alphaproteobacteria bacterium]
MPLPRTLGLLALVGCAVPYDPGYDLLDTDTDTEVDTEVDSDTDVVVPTLAPADTCAGGRDGDLLLPGTYEGTLDGLTASGFGPRCTGMAVPEGVDGFTRVEVPAGATIDVAFEVRDIDSAVYLLRSCGAPEACVVGADRYFAGAAESVSYTNSTDEAGVVLLGLSVVSATDAAGPFDLTVTITTP